MSFASRAAKSVTWTFDPTVSPENDVIRERVLIDGGGSFTGKSVTVDGAMGFVPVMAAVRIISENIASLPLQVFERLAQGKRLAPDHRLYGMLHDSPNPEMGSMVFREAMQVHLETWGNAYAEIEYDTDDFPLYLWPLRPDRMQVYREDGKLVYLYRTLDGKDQRLTRRQVFHIPGIGYDGRVGYSPIHLARQAIALGQATEEFAGRFYSNDGRPGIAIKLGPEYDYDEDAKKRLAESFDATHTGLTNAHRTAVLDEGMSLQEIGWPPELGKMVAESQKWTIPTVSRIFNISPHMLHDLERATFSNIEEQGLNVSTFQFRPRTIRWDQQIKLQLMREDTRHFAEHNLEGFLKGKLEDRMKAYQVRWSMGSLSPNEIRAKENENPIEGGDTYYVPVNYTAVQDEVDENALPVLPPLQLATRSSKSIASRRDLAAEFTPQFEKVTAEIVDFEKRMVLAEAERRFGAESTKAAPTNVEIKLPFEWPAFPEFPPLPEHKAPIVNVTTDTTPFIKALKELREEIRAPRTRKVIRNKDDVIIGSVEESA